MTSVLRGVMTAALWLGAISPVWAQQGRRGLRFSMTTGVSSSVAELAPTRPAGIGFEVQPEWRTSGGFGIGVGFRYVTYRAVPDHGALFLEVKKVWNGPSIQPFVGMRGGLFGGGDVGGDDGFFGLVAGPVAGFEKPLTPGVSLQVAATALELAPLFASRQTMVGLHVGIVLGPD